MVMAATGNGRIVQAIATLLLCVTSTLCAHAAGLQSGPLSDEPIWTDKPVRVDRKTQALERVAAERKTPPLVLRPTTRVKVTDSASFEQDGRFYILTDAVGVHPKQLCRGADQGLIACGQQARIYFRRLIANKMLTCREDFRIGPASYVACTVAEADLATTLVSKGAAWAATPRLMDRQKAAMTAGIGIWIDAECRHDGRCPPPKRRGR